MVAGYTSLRVIEAIHDNDFSIQILPHIALALIITERLESSKHYSNYKNAIHLPYIIDRVLVHVGRPKRLKF